MAGQNKGAPCALCCVKPLALYKTEYNGQSVTSHDCSSDIIIVDPKYEREE